MDDIKELRKKINIIDKKLFNLYQERLNISEKIGDYKKSNNFPVFDKQREEEIKKLHYENIDNFYLPFFSQFYENILYSSKELQYLRQLSPLLKRVIEITKGASLLLNDNFETSSKTSKDNLVTSNDIRVQDYLISELKKITPTYKFFAEENLQEIFDKEDFVWVIDPIDGTANYVHGLNLSVISIALVHNNHPVLGITYNPFTKDIFFAEEGKGAYHNYQKISVSNKKFEDCIFFTAWSLYDKSLAEKTFEISKKIYEQVSDIRRLGSCALELSYLSAGLGDLYFEIKLFPWDFSAGELLIKEAGGFICSLENEISHQKKQAIIAANSEENLYKLREIINLYFTKNLE